MSVLKQESIEKIVDTMTAVILKNEVYFCELDSAAGDGDFGMSLAKGFKELQKNKENLDRSDIGSYIRSCGDVIAENCGGASGPIWGGAFKAAGRYASGKASLTLTEFAEMLRSAAEGIQKRGGAKPGDKTLLDALFPTVEALEAAAKSGSDNIAAALKSGAEAAVKGAEATKSMIASRGRASYVGDRSLGFPDAGAQALGVIFTEIANADVI
ncbi:MAG: dihydroxyacetone kinase subunit L [Clostridiales bacterium]|jgi:dihydroxyacetone kinase|nr:dihydroxyacetone kinase subunit L [Clostridiales bacterium]